MSHGTVSFNVVMSAEGEEDAAERLFELANASHVRFMTVGQHEVSIRQDPANVTTGGCVWETAYLLAQWAMRELEPRLEAHARRSGPAVRCLEVGAGCGLLGISLADAGADVLLTETAAAMPNLEHNVAANPPQRIRGGSSATATLHWGDPAHIASAVARGPFDVLVGTDVVYVEEMVVPLLRTLWRCAGAGTTVWLCGQVRDPDAHAVLTREAPRWFGAVERLALDGESFAVELECFLLQLQAPVPTEPQVAAGEAAPAVGGSEAAMTRRTTPGKESRRDVKRRRRRESQQDEAPGCEAHGAREKRKRKKLGGSGSAASESDCGAAGSGF